ncbi:MAG TPA: TetR/AcrR family transcriptional regulator [Bacillota bacterium]|nr:TetR/AcrR family transcriptional regulator [Bacillota bacterium]
MTFDRRAHIVEAATRSFSLFGYKATTMDQVAKLANVGKGTIYTFFKNKEELFDEIVENLIADMKHAAAEAIEPDRGFQENIHQALYRMLEFRKEHQLTIKIFQEGQEVGTPVVQEMMDRVEQEILSFIEEKVRKAIERKQIRPCDPEKTAFVFIKMYISFIFDWERKRPPLSKEEIAELFDLYIIQGLSRSDS